MRAPDERDDSGWERFKLAIAATGIDADQAVVTSVWSGTATLRNELGRTGMMVDFLKRTNPTSKQIAGELRNVLDDLESAQRRLRQSGRGALATATPLSRGKTKNFGSRGKHFGSRRLACARVRRAQRRSSDSPRNAGSAESVFRRHVLHIWDELAGEHRSDRERLITFVHAAENAFLVKTKRDAIRKWLARHMADMKR